MEAQPIVTNDLSIAGSGSADGGRYRNARINGNGRIDGDLECRSFKSAGHSHVYGNLAALEVIVRGSGSVSGNVRSELLSVSGNGEIRGDVAAGQVKVNGSAGIGGSLTTDTAVIRGSVQIGGDCEAEKFEAYGNFEVGGLLNAGLIDIRLFGPCRAREIGGESIQVRKNGFLNSLASLFGSKLTSLEAGIIEGDVIYLEHTSASVVRGRDVKIGPGCEIGRVEYSNSLYVDNHSAVAERQQL
ncbi:polymer-forming cytoskeletal protein [Paenibacillus sp. UNC499MF]|uniref:polymer-forming cytoskeletal protein n=1 Tax=Paenibacillus sp. UNC499MF TaxID=1502751 RepID=UPI0008A075A8|nr:polymer-forming cytoskeletal protein [Paenibacillus sp. UNC499MF]SEG17624.1 protein CcmA, bactofilin family [Paenibacillus sp. UNC499MF]